MSNTFGYSFNNPFVEMEDAGQPVEFSPRADTITDNIIDNDVDDGQYYEDLDVWEGRLTAEVDDDFFQDPVHFPTLQRVIDFLGAQMDDDDDERPTAITSDYDNLRQYNPAYRALKKQQQVVEEAIEHMAVQYCADLNSSVVQIGKVARQFRDAVGMVRHLRRQLRDIKETLGTGGSSSGGVTTTMANTTGSSATTSATGGGSTAVSPNKGASAAQAAAMSLRELWLKKLECEAVLVLLEKMEIVRAAPAQFDYYMKPPCRIGAAVVTLSRAFEIAFHSKDVSQV